MTDTTQLTQRQRDIYEFIRWFTACHGYAPSVRDIGDEFGIRSPNGVMCHINALKDKGVITAGTKTARSFTLCNGARPTLTLDDVEAACAQECDDRYAELWQLGWRAAMEAVRNKLGINKDGAVTTPHG